MRTDEEILQLFARANPRPRSGAAAPPWEERRLEDLEQRSMDMTDLKIPKSTTTEGSRTYGRGLLCAAVVAAVVVAAGLLLLDRSRETDLAAPADTPVDLAYRIVEARNAFDADALADLLGPAVYGFGGPVDITGYTRWVEVYDWGLLDPTCEQSTDFLVVCSFTVSNRLTRYAGLEGEVGGTLSLRFESGAPTSAVETVDTVVYSGAFDPFVDWVNENHNDAVGVMWDMSIGVRPRLTEESIQLFDEMLTEYTGTG